MSSQEMLAFKGNLCLKNICLFMYFYLLNLCASVCTCVCVSVCDMWYVPVTGV